MDEYSIYEAKTRFSEIIRKVRQGRTVRVTYRGTPVAEIRPLGGSDEDIARRVERLSERGVLQGPVHVGPPRTVVVRRPGALDRFLEEREE